eukprot:Seg1866.7 transcript_id=Seg1866.7/GoldUCD/mRNA.D3Y31 product="Sentrin-specific protease 1" protein_id=Seg1866.7/GoldUCD/D3Y31
MTFHSARTCLLRKKIGIYCTKSECLKRQLVLSNLIRSKAKDYVRHCAPFIKKSNAHVTNVHDVKHVNSRVNTPSRISSQGASIHDFRGRPRERTCTQPKPKERGSRHAVHARKPLPARACGGGKPRSQVDIKRYAETFRTANIPLRCTLHASGEADTISKLYYKQTRVSKSKKQRLTNFHASNYKQIFQEYKKLFGEPPKGSWKFANDESNTRGQKAQDFTANVCYGIMDNVMRQHINSSNLTKMLDFTASVCSKISTSVLFEELERGESSISHATDIERDSFTEENVGENDIDENSDEASEEDLMQNEVATEHPKLNVESSNATNHGKLFSREETSSQKSNTSEDIYADIGLSAETASILAKTTVPDGGSFSAVIDKAQRAVDLDPAWRNLPITTLNGQRRFTGDWTSFFNNVITGINPYCVFSFKNNHIKKEGSRKRKSPFFKADAKCTVDPCQCKAILSIDDEKKNTLSISFVGDIVHKSNVLKSRKITGSEREKLRNEFSMSRKTPSNLFRQKLQTVNDRAFTSGNRTGCGITPKAFQHISSEARAEQLDMSSMSGKVRIVDKDIREKNDSLHKSLMSNQNLRGFVQSNDITNDSISVALFDEGGVRLYRQICSKDVMFFDATGTVVEKLKGCKRILIYSLTTRNPFGKSPPVPLAELISSSHTSGSIRRLFTLLREKEKMIFGNNNQPIAIRTDFSRAIITALVAEYCGGISIEEYVDKCFDVLTGKDISPADHFPIILCCSAHAMKMNAKNVEACIKKSGSVEDFASIKHFAMRVVGLLVNTENIEDAVTLVLLVYIVFNSEAVTPQLTEALSQISELVNDFRFPAISECDETDARVFEMMRESGNCGNGKLMNYINDELQQISLDGTESEEPNKYFLPSYMDYLKKELLPLMPLWSRIMLNSQHNHMKKISYNLNKMVGKTALDAGSTNAYAENYFTFLKGCFPTTPVPLDVFIKDHFNDVQGLRRQYLDTIRLNSGNADKKTGQRGCAFRKLEEVTPRYPVDVEVAIDPDESIEPQIEEEWQKKSSIKRPCKVSGKYQEPPSTPIRFNPCRRLIKGNKTYTKVGKNADKMKFNVFKSQHWYSVSPHVQTTENCIAELEKMYSTLSENERSRISTPRPHRNQIYCICQKVFKESDPMMVQCNICLEWYHHTCISMGKFFLDKQTPRYHCYTCVVNTFKGLMQFTSHNDDNIDDGARRRLQEMYEMWKTLDKGTKSFFLNHIYLPGRYPRTYPKQQIVEIDRGIKNEHLNCWMSAMMQVICGTSLLDLLNSYEGSTAHPLTRILRLCQIRLSKKSKNPIPLRMVADVGKTLDTAMESNFKFDPWLGNERDTTEFYTRIISRYFDDLPSDKMFSDLKLIYFDINYCLNCRGLTGASCREQLFHIDVFDSTTPVMLTDMIWYQLHGRYCDDGSIKDCCTADCTTPKIWQPSFIHNFPSVLVIHFKRGKPDGRISQTPVILDEHLDITKYAAASSGEIFKYALKAVVSHYAYANDQGHYAAHICDSPNVKTFDDTHVKKRRLKNFLTLPAVQNSCLMAFYFLVPDEKRIAMEISAPQISREEQRVVEDFWQGTRAPLTPQLTTHDFRRVCHEGLINGPIIEHFLRAKAESCSNCTVLSTSSTFLLNIQRKNTAPYDVHSFLHKENLLNDDIIIVPVHVQSNHWVIAAIYPPAKCIVVIDSIRNENQGKDIFRALLAFLRTYANIHRRTFVSLEWILVYPRYLSQQIDSTSCGVYACFNGYNCMLQQHNFSLRPENMMHFRYWIMHVACNFVPKRKPQKKTECTQRHDLLDLDNKTLLIRDTLPGHGKIGHFFDSLKKYITARKETIFSQVTDHYPELDTSSLPPFAVSDEGDNESFALELTPDSDGSRSEADEDIEEEITPSSDSEDSAFEEQKNVKEKLTQLADLRELLENRLCLDITKANERYIFLAIYGKECFLKYFRKELAVITRSIAEKDLEQIRGALLQMFRRDIPDDELFGINLPEIYKNRYGLTSAALIDHVIVPDALCLDLMRCNNVTFGEAVSKICGVRGSRITVYWDQVLLKV